jgi:hypothetical protein
MSRWVRAILAFVVVFLGALLLAAIAGVGIGQYELLLIIALAVGAAVMAYRPELIRLRRVA